MSSRMRQGPEKNRLDGGPKHINTAPGKQNVRSRIAVHVTPRASRDAIEGFTCDPNERGEETLHVRVTAPPIESRANVALVRLLARGLNVPRSSIRVTTGEHARHKMVEVTGLDGKEARRRLTSVSAHGGNRRDRD